MYTKFFEIPVVSENMSPTNKLEQIESEILKMFHDCKSQGMSKAEIRDIFAPLGLPCAVNKLNDDKKGHGVTKGLKSSVKKWMGKILRNPWFRNLFIFLTVFAVGGVIMAKNGEEMKTLRFHALAVIRIALIKVIINK